MIRLMIETLKELKLLLGFSTCYHVFAISNFVHVQAFLHCLFTGNETNGYAGMDISVPDNVLRILAWTIFHRPCSVSYCDS